MEGNEMSWMTDAIFHRIMAVVIVFALIYMGFIVRYCYIEIKRETERLRKVREKPVRQVSPKLRIINRRLKRRS